ncbi:DUF6053 domain-containing protein [Lysobacter enzymogenes]|uniref:DUF6053 domain-containing protein n=1 Tax=Lysobacter enzymogenes TaxID=69 RepID=UPI003D1879A5
MRWLANVGVANVGGASAPMPLFRIAATRAQSIGAEAPPTKASGLKPLPQGQRG